MKKLFLSLGFAAGLSMSAKAQTNITFQMGAVDFLNAQRSYTNAVAHGFTNDIISMIRWDTTNFCLLNYTQFWNQQDQQTASSTGPNLAKKFPAIVANWNTGGSNAWYVVTNTLAAFPSSQ